MPAITPAARLLAAAHVEAVPGVFLGQHFLIALERGRDLIGLQASDAATVIGESALRPCRSASHRVAHADRVRQLYVFEKRYTDKLSACADLNMKDKIELQSFCDEIFGDG